MVTTKRAGTTTWFAMVVLAAVGCDGTSHDAQVHRQALAEAPGDLRGPAPVEPGALGAEWATVRVVDHRGASDLDQDGFAVEDDFDDENPFAHPGAEEIPCNDADEDGDGLDSCPADQDADGVRADIDCDDLDPSRSQLLGDIACNGRDENCNGHDDCDSDRDGAMDWYDLDPLDPAVGVPEAREEADHDSP